MTVTVYTKTSCVQCSATIRQLVKEGISYTTVDVATDDTARRFIANLGYKQVPVVHVDQDNHWSGFRPDRVAALSDAAA